MTWQEELRRLDAELAAGTISHDLHRRRREDILAEVSGSPVVSPFASPRTEVGGAPQWQAANPAADAHQATQPPPQPPAPQQPPRVTPASLLSNGRRTTAPSPADTELTMPMSRLQSQPLVTPPPPPENRGRKRTWLLISLGVFVALAAVIGGAWWLGGVGGSSGTPQGDAPRTATSPTPTAEVALEDRLPVLPGEQNSDNSTMSITKGVELGLYPESSAEIFTDAGAKEIVYRASTDGDTAYFLLAVPLENTGAANTVVDRMRELMFGAGFSEETAQATMSGELGERTLNGTWYASGDTAVNLWVSEPTAGGSAERLSELASRAVAEVRAALPLG